MKRILAIAAGLLLIGCRHSPEQVNARAEKNFLRAERHAPKVLIERLKPGKARREVDAFYRGAPRGSAVRPADGWASYKPRERYGGWISEYARTFESLHKVEVQQCVVFDSPGSVSSFGIKPDPDLDFVFFDSGDKLLGFHHHYVGD